MGEADFRRQQRRRAIIAWATGALAVALFTLGAIFGGEKKSSDGPPTPFGYSMTAAEYAALKPGLDEADLVNRLEQTGLPENLTKAQYVELFPPHAEELVCSYWEISDRPEQIARVCFSSSDATLVQKLERSAGEEPAGVSV
jgi:hypothetical protein